MIEVALVFDVPGNPMLWHEPGGRSGGSIPDSRSLWDFLWENRHLIGGVAHTHPFSGEAWPSSTDLTTWAAIEAGLGQRLLWPIVTLDDVKYFVHNPVTQDYIEIGEQYIRFPYELWTDNIRELRLRSHNGG